ncbi:MAG: PaaI family thioesterase [Coriobacteriales bacterium]|jgi:acyl-CoA thioesterase|nr:PaaI family thioesterase [Coriobacteriales bacterium]
MMYRPTHLIPKDASLDLIRTAFSQDRFATGLCGIRIDEARFGHVICSLAIEDKHLNLMDNIMGGVIFTLADFCLAIISNVGEPPSTLVSATIEYLSTAKGDTLIATSRTDKSGKRLGFYTVDIHDNTGVPVARMVATMLRNP